LARFYEEAAERARLEEEQRRQQFALDEADRAEQVRQAAEAAERTESDQRATAAAEFAAMALEVPAEPADPGRDAATQAAAFAELSASASLDFFPPTEVVALDATAAVRPDDDDDDYPTAASYDNRDTDTAALMRELTSLGMDDEASPSAVAPPVRSAVSRPVSAAAQKKRKGLFGRG
jgi:hypothetical protein